MLAVTEQSRTYGMNNVGYSGVAAFEGLQFAKMKIFQFCELGFCWSVSPHIAEAEDVRNVLDDKEIFFGFGGNFVVRGYVEVNVFLGF